MRLRKYGIAQHPTIPVMFGEIAVSLQDGMSSELTRGKLGISPLILVHEGHKLYYLFKQSLTWLNFNSILTDRN